MDVQLRLTHDKVMQHRISAPCMGVVAKALGKYKLEEQLPGLLVKFVSYQEAEGKPAQSLADDQPVLRGSILNFSVNLDTLLKQQRQHNMLLKGLYRGHVLTVISKYSARFLKPQVSEVGDKAGVARFLASDPQKAAATAAALVAVGATMTAVDFAQGLDATCTDRNKLQHVNTNQQLELDMKRMRDDGVVQLMQEDMPMECMIIEHSDVFLALLP